MSLKQIIEMLFPAPKYFDKKRQELLVREIVRIPYITTRDAIEKKERILNYKFY